MAAIVSWITAAVVIFAVVSCTIYYVLYRGWTRWPVTQGTIESLVEIRTMTTGHNSPGPYYGVLSYSYLVGGEYYSGTWETPLFPQREQVTDFFHSRMPAGTKLDVRYHPRDQGRSLADVELTGLDPAAPVSLDIEGREYSERRKY